MSGRNPEIRRARNAVRALAAPAGDFMTLLSSGEEWLEFLSDSPEDLPMVAFSPFASLPGGPVQAPARRTEAPVQRAGRAPGVPPVPARSEPPAAGRAAAVPPPRSRPVAAVETIRPQPVPAVPPVFSFRRQGGKAEPVPSAPAAREAVPSGNPGSPSAKRTLSLSDLLSLKAEEVWPEEQRMAENTGLIDPAGGNVSGEIPSNPEIPPHPGQPRRTAPTDALSGRTDSDPGGDLPPVLPARGALEALMAAGRGGAAAVEIPLAEETGRPLELLNDLADRVLRRQDGTVPGLDAPVPDRAGLTAAREVKARFLAVETRAPEPEPAPALPASAGPALLDAESLADLINEALVEQARRHGVDLS